MLISCGVVVAVIASLVHISEAWLSDLRLGTCHVASDDSVLVSTWYLSKPLCCAGFTTDAAVCSKFWNEWTGGMAEAF